MNIHIPAIGPMRMVDLKGGFIASVGIITIAYVLALLAPSLEGILTCEEFAGYNPHGMTDADRYVSGTWASTCITVENTVLFVPRVLSTVLAPYMA